MITKFIKALAAIAALGLSLTTFAQVTVLDFTSPGAPVAISEGSWTGPVDNGSFQRFQNLSTSDFDGATFNFDQALNLSGLDSLTLTARSIDIQTGITLTLLLIDGNSNSASAMFDLGSFPAEMFTTQSVQWTDLSGGAFDSSAIWSVRFTGADPTAAGLLNFDAQKVQAFSSVPEPSTYAAAGAGGLLLLAGLRRRKQGRKA